MFSSWSLRTASRQPILPQFQLKLRLLRLALSALALWWITYCGRFRVYQFYFQNIMASRGSTTRIRTVVCFDQALQRVLRLHESFLAWFRVVLVGLVDQPSVIYTRQPYMLNRGCRGSNNEKCSLLLFPWQITSSWTDGANLVDLVS